MSRDVSKCLASSVSSCHIAAPFIPVSDHRAAGEHLFCRIADFIIFILEYAGDTPLREALNLLSRYFIAFKVICLLFQYRAKTLLQLSCILHFCIVTTNIAKAQCKKTCHNINVCCVVMNKCF